ncbi:MAG: putative toxin-antitoxin system toxin component, PIN family [Chthoniobacteraceae bacterium]
MLRAVVDTNVIFAALYSNAGASYRLLQLLVGGHWKLVISNVLLAEYEEVLKRNVSSLGMSVQQLEDFLDSLCAIAERHHLKSQWIPILDDPDDEAQVHLASEASTDYIVTHNLKHLNPARTLGIQVITPKEFLTILKDLP